MRVDVNTKHKEGEVPASWERPFGIETRSYVSSLTFKSLLTTLLTQTLNYYNYVICTIHAFRTWQVEYTIYIIYIL